MGIDRLAVRITWFVVNYTSLSPNHITMAHFSLKIVAALLFYLGSGIHLILGGLTYFISITLDDVDGKVARVRNQESLAGKYYDFICDAIGDFLCVAALVYNCYLISGRKDFWMITGMTIPFLYLFISYESILSRESESATLTDATPSPAKNGFSGPAGAFLKKIKLLQEKYQTSFLTLDMADIAVLMFVVGPLFNAPAIFLVVGLLAMIQKIFTEKSIMIFRRRFSFGLNRTRKSSGVS